MPRSNIEQYTTEQRINLVIAACNDGLSDSVEWKVDKIVRQVESDPRNGNLQARWIKAEARKQIANGSATVIECLEERPFWKSERTYYYFTIIAIPGNDFPKGLFVEIELDEESTPDDARIFLLNAHPPREQYL